MITMHRLLPLALMAALLSLAGCAALSPYSDMTKLDLTLNRSDELNPDLNGRPSPIVLRLIELKHPVAFETPDFFSLYQRPKEALSPDMVVLEELELRPGEQHQMKLSLQPGSRYVGVLAAYRDLPESNWRTVISLKEQEHNYSVITLDAKGIQAPDKADKDED